MEEKLMVTITLDEYRALVRDQARLYAIVDFTLDSKFSIERDTIFALSSNGDFVEREEEK